MRRTKIVGTIGPASIREDTFRKLIEAGLNVARVNFSHGNRESITTMVNEIRRIADDMDSPLAILGDLQGPKLRLGKVPNDEIVLKKHQKVLLSADSDETDPAAIPFPHPEIFEAIEAGARLVLGDGEVELHVEKRDGLRLYCVVFYEGLLGSRKGVNLPGTLLPISSITEKDKVDLETACDLDLDYVALSFVRSAEDVVELRSMMAQYGRNIPIIAKIEKEEAIESLEAIGNVCDGMMVARGDLGIDLPPQYIPVLQKRIIKLCNELGKPVITATQMLQSMVNNPVPTRAEATDVANAILDGSDAIMLSAETATGRYPAKSVRMMRDIALLVEEEFPYEVWDQRRVAQLRAARGGVAGAISSSACGTAKYLQAKAIVTTTVSGYTARQVARYRPATPIVALTPEPATQRRLSLLWGVTSLLASNFGNTDEMVEQTAATVAQTGDGFAVNDRIVMTGGVPFGKSGLTNLLIVHELTEEDFEA